LPTDKQPFVNADSSEPQSVSEIRSLVQDRRLTKEFSETDVFKKLLLKLRHSMRSHIPFDVWMSLSIAGRAASVSKPMEKLFHAIVRDRLTHELPKFEPLHDGEDRWYLAKALQTRCTTEVASIAFSEIAREDVGEKARRVWVSIGFEISENRQEFLSCVNQSIGECFGADRSRSDVLARRIRRIITAIKNNLMLTELAAGVDYSRQLKVLCTGHISKDGPEDKGVREELARDVMAALIDIVRLSLAASSDPLSYDIAKELKGWWAPASPPHEIDMLSRKLARNGIDTLLVFARQGHRNNPLRRSLAGAVGAKVFTILAKDAVERDSSLPEDVSAWFITGEDARKRQSSGAVEALSAERLDGDISRLLIYGSSSEIASPEIARLSEEIEDLMPEQAKSIMDLSRFRSAPSAHLGGFLFKSQGAFPA